MKSLRSLIVPATAALLLFGPLHADDAQSVTVQSMPGSVDEFIALRDELAGTPEGGAAVFLVAMMAYVEDTDLGEQFLTIALDRNNLSKGQAYKGYAPASSIQYHLKRIQGMRYLPRSYVVGSSPDNGYTAAAPYRFDFSRNRFSKEKEDRIKVFVACSGADTPRPITMQKNNRGVWKAYNASSVFVGIRKPAGSGTVDDEL